MSVNRDGFGTDFAKLDAHVIQPEEYDDAPELTDEFFDQAVAYVGGKRVPGQVTMQFDPEVLEHFRAKGDGNWRKAVNSALHDIMISERKKPAA